MMSPITGLSRSILYIAHDESDYRAVQKYSIYKIDKNYILISKPNVCTCMYFDDSFLSKCITGITGLIAHCWTVLGLCIVTITCCEVTYACLVYRRHQRCVWSMCYGDLTAFFVWPTRSGEIKVIFKSVMNFAFPSAIIWYQTDMPHFINDFCTQ